MNDIDTELKALPVMDPSRDLDAEVRRRARVELTASPAASRIARAFRACTRVALPVAIAITAVGYLHWAVAAVTALHH